MTSTNNLMFVSYCTLLSCIV